MMNRLLWVTAGVASGALFVVAADGCGTEDIVFHCNPDASDPDPLCTPDAGVDASPEAAAIACKGDCVWMTDDAWSDPRLFWIGPVDQAPSECLGSAPIEAIWRYADPVADPLACDECACTEPEGTCGGLPEQIEIRAAVCKQEGPALPFGGPEGWDGSCTAINAIPGGAKCPEGSSTLCAQSVAASPLAPPIEEPCTAYTVPSPIPRVWYPPARWQTVALGCKGWEDKAVCPSGQACVPTADPPPEGYQHCVYRDGDHDCPSEYDGPRFLVYPEDAIIDSRVCSECTCGQPTGGVCVGRFKVYQDSSCSELLANDQVASVGDQCSNVFPPGLPIGSKAITDLERLPGACEPSVSEPSGTVTPNHDFATTVCCLSDKQ
jgi:hypothetical protein